MEYILEQLEPGKLHLPIVIHLESEEIVIGKSTIASLSSYKRVSRRHAVIQNRNGFFYIKDVGTYGNLYINSVKVGRDFRRLEIGNILSFGMQYLNEKDCFHCVFTTRTKVKSEIVTVDESENGDLLHNKYSSLHSRNNSDDTDHSDKTELNNHSKIKSEFNNLKSCDKKSSHSLDQVVSAVVKSEFSSEKNLDIPHVNDTNYKKDDIKQNGSATEKFARKVKTERIEVIDLESESDIFESNSDEEPSDEISILEYVRKEPLVKIPGLNLVFGEEENLVEEDYSVLGTDNEGKHLLHSGIVRNSLQDPETSVKCDFNEMEGPKIVTVEFVPKLNDGSWNQSDTPLLHEIREIYPNNNSIQYDCNGSLSNYRYLKFPEQKTTYISKTSDNFQNSRTQSLSVDKLDCLSQKPISVKRELVDKDSCQISDNLMPAETSKLISIKKEVGNVCEIPDSKNLNYTLPMHIPLTETGAERKVDNESEEFVHKHSVSLSTDTVLKSKSLRPLKTEESLCKSWTSTPLYREHSSLGDYSLSTGHYSEKESSKSVEHFDVPMKCSVVLHRCDRENFSLPSDVKRVNLTNNKKNYHKLNEGIRKLRFNEKLVLNSKRNRILNSESSLSGEESENPLFVKMAHGKIISSDSDSSYISREEESDSDSSHTSREEESDSDSSHTSKEESDLGSSQITKGEESSSGSSHSSKSESVSVFSHSNQGEDDESGSESDTYSKLVKRRYKSAAQDVKSNSIDIDNEDESDSANTADEDSDSSISCKSIVVYPSSNVLNDLKCKVEKSDSSIHEINFSSQTSFREKKQIYKRKLATQQHFEVQQTIVTNPKPLKRKRRRILDEKSDHEKKQNLSSEFHDRKNKLSNSSRDTENEIHSEGYSNKFSNNTNGNNQSKTTELLSGIENSSIKGFGRVMVGSAMQNCNFKIPKRGKVEKNSKLTTVPSTLKSVKLKPKSSVPQKPSNYSSRIGVLIETSQQVTNVVHRKNNQKKINLHIKPNEFKKINLVENSKNTSDLRKEFESQRTLSENEPKKISGVLDRQKAEKSLPTQAKSLLSNDKSNVKYSEKIKEPVKFNTIFKKCEKLPFNVKDNLSNKSRSEISGEIGCSSLNCNSKFSSHLPQNRVEENKKCESKKYKNLAIVLPQKRSADKMKDEANSVFSQYNSLSVTRMMVYWSPKWLQEQKDNSKPPPLFKKKTNEVGLCFENCESYLSSFYPLLILDIWEHLYKDSKAIFGSNYMNYNNFYCRVSSFLNKNAVTKLQCEAAVSQRLPFTPLEGSVILLNIQNQEKNIAHYLFGYVSWHQFDHSSESIKAPEWKQIPSNWLNDSRMCFLTIYIKRRLNINLKSLMLAHGICNIKYELNLINCLNNLKSSPLCDIIIRPNRIKFPPSESTSPQEFINLVSNGIMEKDVPKIFLLQGAPGTGKTSVLIEILQNVFHKSASRAKFLVCASSSSAVSEIGLRLLNFQNSYQRRTPALKFVLMADFIKTLPYMRKFLLQKQVLKVLKNVKIKKGKIEESLNSLSAKINSLASENRNTFEFHTQRQLDRLKNQFYNLKQQSLKNSQLNSHVEIKFKILDEADVIVSTLDLFQACVSGNLYSQKFSLAPICCIVDEANLCTEPELLQCLSSDVRKLILMSDSRFPPASESQNASKFFSQKRSMFERFHSYFKNNHQNPIFILKEQYRMHSEICRFPSRYFYENQILTSLETDLKYESFPVKPYTVIDILNPDSLSLKESDVTQLLNEVCMYFVNYVSMLSVGIITDEYFVPLYRQYLSLNPYGKYFEVNTVDGFRNREKDIIVATFLSTPNSINAFNELVTDGEKLNVILTRPRQCLLLYGHISSLNRFKHWEALLTDAKSRNFYICLSSIAHMPVILREFICKTS